MQNDKLILGGHEFSSRFILGSGKYSLKLIQAAVEYAGAELITLAVRRANTKDHENILDYIPKGVTLLPNTSGARNAEEAVRIARLARELGCGDFVKIEIMRDSKYLLPDNQETVKATEILAKDGFVVMPYMYPDLYTARDLANAGAACVMPLASPIGSNKGLATKEFIQILVDEIDLPIIVDAGIGRPSQACEAMEMGAAAIMANTALATALHVYYLQRKYPHAEMSLSCPRLRPIVNNDKINPLDVHEKELCQILCAYRIFLPFAGITVSSRESASFRDGIVKIAATKVSAGVSTGIGDHESKYTGQDAGADEGDEQFEINDGRSFAAMYEDMSQEGLQPVLNDYLYV